MNQELIVCCRGATLVKTGWGRHPAAGTPETWIERHQPSSSEPPLHMPHLQQDIFQSENGEVEGLIFRDTGIKKTSRHVQWLAAGQCLCSRETNAGRIANFVVASARSHIDGQFVVFVVHLALAKVCCGVSTREGCRKGGLCSHHSLKQISSRANRCLTNTWDAACDSHLAACDFGNSTPPKRNKG